MHADKCPICDGTGRVSHISIDGVGYGEPVTCNGCNGKGWVSVMDSPAEIYPDNPDIHPNQWRNSIKSTLTSSDMNNYMG